MSDRTYTWIATPLSALTAALKPTIAIIFQTSLENLLHILAEPALPDDALGQDNLAVRLVDGVPCLVWEDIEADRGGADVEPELQSAGIPYLLRHNAGEEYGPGRTVCMGTWCVTIRTDRDGFAVAGLRVVQGRAEADPSELADLEAYDLLRSGVLRGVVPVPRPLSQDG